MPFSKGSPPGAPRCLIWDTRTSEVSLELPSHTPVHTGLPSSTLVYTCTCFRGERAAVLTCFETVASYIQRGWRLTEAIPVVLPRPPTVPALVRVAVTMFLVDSCGMPTTTLSALHAPCPRFSSRETGETQIFLPSPGLPEPCAAAMFPFTLPPAKQSRLGLWQQCRFQGAS